MGYIVSVLIITILLSTTDNITEGFASIYAYRFRLSH